MKSRAITVFKGKASLRDIILREIEEGEILVETIMSAVSPGTELRCLAGKQEGQDHTRPFVPGYANVGVVLESKSPTVTKGCRVFSGGSVFTGDYSKMWGAHMGHTIVRADDAVPVPDSVSSESAALSALGSIALHGVKRGGVKPGESVASIGLGAIGSLSALLHRHFGGDVVACDLSALRVELAGKIGVRAFKAGPSLKEGFQVYQPKGADLVVDSTGVSALLPQALDLLGDTDWDNRIQGNRRCLLQGSYVGEFTADYRVLFAKQASLIVPRDRQKRDVEEFLGLLEAKAIKPEPLISQILPAEEAGRGYGLLKDPLTTPGTVLFQWK